MKVHRLSLLEGAHRATGVAIVIDVYRAFTTAAVAFSRGAQQIVLVDSPATALTLRQQGVGDLIMGEEGGKRIAGFDYGNSPCELSQADVSGKRLIQSTSAGTKGVVAAGHADAIYLASLVNAAATADAVRSLTPATVSIIAMGNRGVTRAEEDEECAGYIAARLQGEEVDQERIIATILAAASSKRFDDPAQPHFRLQDREIALQIDSIPIAMPVQHVDGMLVAKLDLSR